MESHLLQMRGLKLLPEDGKRLDGVASFTDAWIETLLPKWLTYRERSHLLQMRGLKQKAWSFFQTDIDGRIFYRCVD